MCFSSCWVVGGSEESSCLALKEEELQFYLRPTTDPLTEVEVEGADGVYGMSGATLSS